MISDMPSPEVVARFATKPPTTAKPIKSYPSESPASNRTRYLKWKAKQPRKRTAYAAKYGTVGIKLIIADMVERLGISESAARMRWYRGK